MRTLFAMAAIVLAAAGASSAQVLFSDSFEAPTNMSNWIGWDPDKGATCTGCGPFKLFTSDNHVVSGTQAARQEQAQPWWYGSMYDFYNYLPQDKVLRLSGWQFEDYNKKVPFTPGQPGYQNHDQVQGWLGLLNQDGTEAFLIGVHAHWASPAPVLDWWGRISWYTTTDGWHTTTLPRRQGWRKYEIVVHPYTGHPGDVEFFVDGAKVADGRRSLGGPGCSGIPLDRIGIGSNPNWVFEDYISNSYEFFWYDDIELTAEAVELCPSPRFDSDGDHDVDMNDFGAFQLCWTGTATLDCACRCMDANGDNAINLIDFAAFQACASRDGVPAPAGCDGTSAAP